MKILRVTPNPEQIELRIKLRHFITDWPSAQQKFVAGITRRLHDLTAIQPHDLNMSYGNSLGDASCTCRLFGGAASIVLNADTLKLSFENVTRAAYKVVFQAIRRGWEFLASEFPKTELLGSRCTQVRMSQLQMPPRSTRTLRNLHTKVQLRSRNRRQDSGTDRRYG